MWKLYHKHGKRHWFRWHLASLTVENIGWNGDGRMHFCMVWKGNITLNRVGKKY